MAVPGKVVVLGFDAMEATLVERWAAEGSLPTFARVTAAGTAIPLDTCMDTFPAAIWQELTTGRSAATLGWYWQPQQVHAGEAQQRSREDPLDEFRNEPAGSGRDCRLLLQQLTLPSLQTTVGEKDRLSVPGEPKRVDKRDGAEEVPRIDHGIEGDRRGGPSHSRCLCG